MFPTFSLHLSKGIITADEMAVPNQMPLFSKTSTLVLECCKLPFPACTAALLHPHGKRNSKLASSGDMLPLRTSLIFLFGLNSFLPKLHFNLILVSSSPISYPVRVSCLVRHLSCETSLKNEMFQSPRSVVAENCCLCRSEVCCIYVSCSLCFMLVVQ